MFKSNGYVKRFDDLSSDELLNSDLFSLCSCEYCQATKHIKSVKSYRILNSNYYVTSKDFCISDRVRFCLLTFSVGCGWSTEENVAGSVVAHNLLELGFDSVAYHLDLFI